MSSRLMHFHSGSLQVLVNLESLGMNHIIFQAWKVMKCRTTHTLFSSSFGIRRSQPQGKENIKKIFGNAWELYDFERVPTLRQRRLLGLDSPRVVGVFFFLPCGCEL